MTTIETMNDITFTSTQKGFLDRFMREKIETIVDYLREEIEVSESKLKEILGDYLSIDEIPIMEGIKKTKKGVGKKKKSSDEEVFVEDTDDESSGKTKKTKSKKEKKVKKEKGHSKTNGFRVYMFGLKDNDEFPDRIKQMKANEAFIEEMDDKSSGEIHRTAVKRVSAAWNEMDEEAKTVFKDKAKEVNLKLTE